MKNIMMATDFSERSDRALRRAILLARQLGAGITLVHVVDDDQQRRIVEAERDAAETLLRQMGETLRDADQLECETRIILASPFAGIVQAVEDGKPDLLVIGPHRRQVLRDVFIGTTAERTIRAVGCPVLMVNAPPAGNYRHVMQTTDLSDGSREALQRFPSLGISGEARNSLLYVYDAPALRLAFSHTMPKSERETYRSDESRDASRRLSEFLATANFGGVAPMVRFEATTAQHEILEAADAEKADLVVISTHGQTGIAKLFIGSVTEQVLRMSPVDVLALPPLRSA
ncbi:MAG: universal stress protein [Hoeflea sp.]|uniref:universal stress protein n=1 Tax=Hoeflea sp. TaxID=1940281 RepID=UPI003298ABAA